MILRKTFVLVALLSLAASAAICHVPPGDETLLWYMGNCDPITPNSAGPGLRFILRSYAVNMGSVVIDNLSGDPDYNASDSLAWRVIDNDDGSRACWRTGPQHEIDHITGATVVARVKTVSSTPSLDGTVCGNVGMYDASTSNTCLFHWGGANNYIEETTRDVSATPTGDDKYHIIRMTVKGRLYYDPEWPDETWYEDFEAYLFETALDGQGWWDGGAPGGMEINPTPPPEYRPAPGLTVVADPVPVPVDHGQVCAMVFGVASYDETIPVIAAADPVTGEIIVECDMLGTDMSDPENSKVGWYIDFNDFDGASFCSWNGAASWCRARIGAGSTVTDSYTFTKTAWDHLKVVIDTVNRHAHFYVNDEELLVAGDPPHPPDLNPASSGSWLGSVKVSSTYDIYARDIVYMDNFDLTAVHLTPTEEEGWRTINLYVDENPTPVITISPASATSADLEGWYFGTESFTGLGQQDIYFDWITGSNLGAFAPGEEEAAPPGGIGQSLIPPASTPLSSIDDIKTAADAASVIMDGDDAPVVTIPYSDDNNAPWFFGIEKDDRSAGLRVLCSDWVTAGVKAKIWGVANTTPDGERVIVANAEIVDYTPYSIPDALCMNNRATGGGALGAQQAVKEYTEWLVFDGFSYPDGPLLGNDGWTIGDADANHIGVVSGAVRVYWNIGNQSVARALAPLPGSTTQRLTFKATPGSAGVEAGNIWYVWLQDGAGTEIGRWYGYWNTAKARYGDFSIGPNHTLSVGGNNLGIEWVAATNTVNFYYDGALDYSVATGASLTPGRAYIQNAGRATEELTQYIVFDNMSLTDMAWVGLPDRECTGLNNVGLIQRLYGKVTEAYTDLITPTFATSYFYIDDGTGILGPAPHKGIRCMAPRSSSADDLPAVDSYVWVYGILGMQGGERYMYTYDGSWVIH